MRLLLLLLIALSAIPAQADTSRHIRDIISRGNRAYDLSQYSRIRQCADSATMLLATGNLDPNDSTDLQASVYKLFGNYHYLRAMPDSSAMYYAKATETVKSHPQVAFRYETRLLLFRDLAQLYYQQKDYPLAAEFMAKADTIIEDQNMYEVGSDDWLTTKLSYAMCLARIKDFDQALEIADTELAGASDKTSLAYARAERMRGKILLLANAGRLGALRAYKDYFNRQKQFALENFATMDAQARSEYWHSLQPFIADCYQLEDADAGFLYDVALFSKGLLLQLSRLCGNGPASESALKSLKYRWSDIQRRLKTGHTAVEFIQYEKDGEQRMGALVLKRTGRPKFVSMAHPADVVAYCGKEIQSTDRSSKDKLYSDSLLYGLVWNEALLKAIAGSKRIYFAPDGYQHRLAIEYLPPVQDYEMYRLTSTRRLMEPATPLSATAPTLLMGGINYDLDKAPGSPMDNDSTAYAGYVGTRFSRLDEATNEARYIFERRQNDADSLIVASDASEAAFRSAAPGYEAILVSTHGDFSSTEPLTSDLKPADDNSAMSQNIIALAGVNAYLRNDDFDPTAHCDGLLSARELADMDLTDCRLFTVSACQSALGDISSDGVFGLQRGLKNAGVGAMLLSLWNVNSDATAALMNAFYAELADGKSIGKAFASARATLLSTEETPSQEEQEEYVRVFNPAIMASRPVRKDAAADFSAPQHVNAFIMIDAID